MIRKIFDSKSRTITNAALVLAVASVASRVLGFARDRVIASTFGASQATDIYYASFRLPDLIFNLVVLGAISSAFIPVLSRYFARKKQQEGFKMANVLLNFMMLTLLVLTVLLYWLMPYILPALISFFEHGDQTQHVLDVSQINETIRLTRIMLISPLILGASSILGGILNVTKQFVTYALAPVMYNIGIILGAVVFVPFWGLTGLAYGVVLGTFLHLLIQLPSVIRSGFRFRPSFDFKQKGFVRVLRLMVPRTIALAIGQINFFVMSFIAFGLAEGELSVFNFGMNLQSFPLGVFALSFAVAALPILSRHAEEKDMRMFIRSFSKTFRQILYFIIPSSILLLVLRAQIVRVALGSGEFDWNDTYLTAQVLGIFSLSLFAQGLIPLITRGFYALHNTVTPFLLAGVSAVVNIALAFALTGIWSVPFLPTLEHGVMGLALAYTISQILHVLLLLIFFYLRVGYLDDFRIIRSVFKVATSSFFAGVSAYGTLYFLAPLLDTRTGFGILLQGLLAGLVGGGVYLLLTFLMRTSESYVLIHSFRKRLQKVEGWLNKG